MLRDAELFLTAEQMLVEVLGRIRDEHREVVLPALSDVAGDGPVPLRRAVRRYLAEDARVPDLLRGGAWYGTRVSACDVDWAWEDRQAHVIRVATAAGAAAARVVDGTALVHSAFGDVSTQHYLRRLTIGRCLLAHHVAFKLGSTACPLPEDLARTLWELTAPEAATWRSLGVFRTPRPLPENVSWRDRLLLGAGHDPHPVED